MFWILCVFGILICLEIALQIKRRRLREVIKKTSYIADPSAFGGSPPRLECLYCNKRSCELFFGACRDCAAKNNVPIKFPGNEWINKKMGR